jgi:putative heme-binding domain-containing protein
MKRFLFFVLAVPFVLFVLAARVPAQRELTKIPDPDPEIERQSFQVADGFEVNLFAADPLLAKPIQINFDPAGRLWVACSEVYPQIRPGQTANDKILILEDRDGDGRADKTTVFADGLLIPTGVEPGDGGAYVANSTDLVHLSDTDGDGKADRVRVLLSGFGTEDTHHILHTFRWGPEGLLYFNQSIYIHSHIETPHGVRRLDGGGIWQFRPETLELNVVARGFVNPWGHHFDRWGQHFATDGAFGEGVNFLVPGASYITAVGATRFLTGMNPGSPKHCGLEILSGRHLPADWRGNVITNDFRGHRVCRFVLREEGSGYTSQEMPELIKTNHAAFRPVDVKMGPDGAIYIADWYNPIIQHGEVDFRDPRRDHTHGRIWRVTANGRLLAPRPQLVGASTERLLEALKSPEDWTRHQAKRVLKERGQKVLPAVQDWIRHLDSTDPNYEHHLLEGLWTCEALNTPNPELKRLLEARDHHARAAGTRILGDWHTQFGERALSLLAKLVADDHPQVRLEAVRVLARIPDLHAADLALQALDRPVDKYLDSALWQTLRELEPVWMPALEKGVFDFGGNRAHLLFALRSLDSAASVKPLVRLLHAGKINKEQQGEVLGLLAERGGPAELQTVLDRVLEPHGLSSAARIHLLQALEDAARKRTLAPAGDLSPIQRLLRSDDEAVRNVACRLVGLWHLESLRPALMTSAENPAQSKTVRSAAIDALASLGGSPSRDVLGRLARQAVPPDVRCKAIGALAALDLKAASACAAEFLTAARVQADPTDAVLAILQRKNGDAVLAQSIASRQLSADAARLAIRAVRASGRDLPGLVETLRKAGGLTSGPRILSAQEMRQTVADVQRRGNPARGEAIFRRPDLLCFKCHSIAGAGGQVGPDLVSIGASAPIDYLIESILVPNKAVKENYHSTTIATKDGRFLTGIKVRETRSDLVLRDAEDREIAIPSASIEDRAMGGSLMPEGLADALSRNELVDLVRFLSELGKVGPYAVRKAPLVRRWQVLESTQPAHELLQGTSFAAATGENPALHWLPAYSTVAGVLPLDALPPFAFTRWMTKEIQRYAFVRCQIDAPAAARSVLQLNSSTGLRLWLDNLPVQLSATTPLDLRAGRHTLMFVVDLDQRKEPLECQITDRPDSAAHVQIVTGK